MPLSDDRLISLVRRDGLLTPEQVREAREEARRDGVPMIGVIRRKKWLDDAEMAHLEAADAIVAPPGTIPGSGSSATSIGSPADFGASAGNRPTAAPHAAAETERATVVPGTPATLKRFPAPPPVTPPPVAPAAPSSGLGSALVALLALALAAVAIYGGLVLARRRGEPPEVRRAR